MLNFTFCHKAIDFRVSEGLQDMLIKITRTCTFWGSYGQELYIDFVLVCGPHKHAFLLISSNVC